MGERGFAEEYAVRAAEEWARGVRSMAEELRHLADNIDRRANPGLNLRTLTPDFHGALHDVLHDLTTGLANSGVERLSRRALEAHTAAIAVAPPSSEGGEGP